MRGFCLEVSGPYACFTRPEMKAERVSYDVITPSAARAIFEAILWKPAIQWQVNRIDVLNPIQWISVRRNEVAKKASARSDGIFIEEDRQQRAGLFLRDVRYRLYGEFEFIPPEDRASTTHPLPDWLQSPGDAQAALTPDVRPDETEAKYAAMFERRAKKGQCFNQPYLGCREFSCNFSLIQNPEINAPVPVELQGEKELGWMFYDYNFSDPEEVRPLFFKATMKDGTILVPSRTNHEEVRG